MQIRDTRLLLGGQAFRGLKGPFVSWVILSVSGTFEYLTLLRSSDRFRPDSIPFSLDKFLKFEEGTKEYDIPFAILSSVHLNYRILLFNTKVMNQCSKSCLAFIPPARCWNVTNKLVFM